MGYVMESYKRPVIAKTTHMSSLVCNRIFASYFPYTFMWPFNLTCQNVYNCRYNTKIQQKPTRGPENVCPL